MEERGKRTMPSHSHTLQINGKNVVIWKSFSSGSDRSSLNWDESPTATLSMTPAGGSQSHNNIQPYITVYMWRRTA